MALEILARTDVKVGTAGYEREAIEELLDTLEHHPLSMELVLPHLRGMKPAEAGAELRSNLDKFARPEAAEERNRGLLASLAFSTERLSAEARGVLPYLAWFDGGAFEKVLLDFSGLPAEAWGRVRAELVGTALVEEDRAVLLAGRPYLKFHPTLPFAAAPAEAGGGEAEEERFIGIYLGLMGAVAQALRGPRPAGGMAVMVREEGNMRRAAALAFRGGRFQDGADIADTVDRYLAMAGRTRDRANWAAWTQKQMAGAARGPAAWNAERQHAEGLLASGQVREALELLVRQEAEIEASQPGEDAERQRALCRMKLGRIWNAAGRPQLAVGPLEQAVHAFERLGDKANLIAALGGLANALPDLGRFAEALGATERVVTLARERGDARDEAAGLGQTAQILAHQHRLAEAQGKCQEALEAARRAGDAGLEGKLLQHMGSLARAQRDPAQAVRHYREALVRFQAADDRVTEMQTYNLLGTAEANLNHFTAARAWYTQAEVLAKDLGDETTVAAVAQNLGILLQGEALSLPDQPETREQRHRLLTEAAASVTQSLEIDRKRGDEVGEASSLSQLGVLHRHMGNLDDAEQHAQQALAIRERLSLPQVRKDYASLEKIATARGAAAHAASWRAKKEAKQAELARLAQGDGPPRLPPQAREALLGLCQAVFTCRAAERPAPPDLAEAVANLCAAPDPFAAAGRFLSEILSGGALPAPPDGLPPELHEILQELHNALSNSP